MLLQDKSEGIKQERGSAATAFAATWPCGLHSGILLAASCHLSTCRLRLRAAARVYESLAALIGTRGKSSPLIAEACILRHDPASGERVVCLIGLNKDIDSSHSPTHICLQDTHDVWPTCSRFL